MGLHYCSWLEWFSLCVYMFECTCIYLCIHGSQRSLLEVFLTCFLPLKKAFSCMYARMSVCENEQMCVYPGKTEELDPL